MTALLRLSFLCLAVIIPMSSALAHAEGGRSGWMHPFTGLDHMVAMVAIGAWSAQLGGRAVWTIPALFVCFMAVGGLIGFTLVDLPYTETGVALSVLMLGTAIALGQRLPMAAAAPAVAIFGVVHGYLHGYEMPVEQNKALYMLGFLASTAALHIVGLIAAHLAIKSRPGDITLKLTGGLAAIFGMVLLS